MIAWNKQEETLIRQHISYIASGFLSKPTFLDTQQSTYTFYRSLQPKCIEICPLFSLIYTTLYQCCIHLNIPVFAYPDFRYRDNNRYTLIVFVRVLFNNIG